MRTLFLLAPLLVHGAAALAQNPSPRVGVFGGMNLAHIEGTATDISNHKGLAVGAYVAAPFSPEWSVQLGAEWTQKGWERDEPGTHDLAVFKLAYVEIPLLLRYDIAPLERVGALIFAGPGLGFRSGCSTSATTHSTGQTATVTCDEIERASNGSLKVSSFDVGAMVGAGVRFAVSRAQLVATARYEAGFKAVTTSGDNKNRVMTFAVGLELPVGRK